MNPIDQAHNYNKIAHHWDGPKFYRDNGIEQHKRALKYSKASGKAIDIGCGSSGRIIDLMLVHGFSVEGLDLSIEMLNLAKKRHEKVTFHHANVCEWEFTQKYDFISAWDSIWHIPLEQQESVLQKLCEALSPGGIFIFTSGAVNEAGTSSNDFLGQELYHAVLGTPALLKLMDKFGCVCRHLENDDWPNSHLYIIAEKMPNNLSMRDAVTGAPS
jgi:SAM-dependent methyltransferase